MCDCAICTRFNKDRFLSNKRGTHYGSAEGNDTLTSCTMHMYTCMCDCTIAHISTEVDFCPTKGELDHYGSAEGDGTLTSCTQTCS